MTGVTASVSKLAWLFPAQDEVLPMAGSLRWCRLRLQEDEMIRQSLKKLLTGSLWCTSKELT